MIAFLASDDAAYVTGQTRRRLRRAVDVVSERTEAFVVEGRLLTDVGRHAEHRRALDPGHDRDDGAHRGHARARAPSATGRVTVGFEVCVKHVAGALEGAQCTAHAKLNEIVDGRKLRFDVEVREGDRTIGVGTHERRAIAQ